jgi:TRAP-type C4-dicarboxylate transport system permease small subunit
MYSRIREYASRLNFKASTRILTSVLLGSAGGCFLLGAGITIADITLRSTVGGSIPAAIELTSFSIGLGALISIPVCFAKRTHVTAKLLSDFVPWRFGRLLNILSAAASWLFAGALMWIVGQNTLSKLGSPEVSPDLGLPMPALLGIVTVTLIAAFVAAIAGLYLELKKSEQ